MVEVGYNAYKNAVEILATESSDIYEKEQIQHMLEDVNSPVTRKYHEKMFKSVVDKAHIDFGDIPTSRGNIRRYSGYNSMVETIGIVKELAKEDKAKNVLEYADIVDKAIKFIADLSATYEKGFSTHTDYVALEYNSYVYFCVEATTSLIYSFVEIMKDPEKGTLDMVIKNNKVRANEFYFEQLKKFNAAQEHMGINYRKMLEAMCSKGRDNFAGQELVVGTAALIAIATSIVPITRGVIYQIYNCRGKLSSYLELQAEFLELNKTRVESNGALTTDKKQKILKKQEKIVQKLRKISDNLRVQSARSVEDSKKSINNENKSINTNSLKDEIDNSDYQIL